jgi:DNA-binding NtrC family response regulator
MGFKVLLLEDDHILSAEIVSLLAQSGCDTERLTHNASLLSTIKQQQPTLCILNASFLEGNRIELLRQIKEENPVLYTVMLSRRNHQDQLLRAIKLGVFDYLTEPLDPIRLRIILEKIAMERNVWESMEKLKTVGEFEGFNGTSEVMQKLYKQIELAAATSANVIICGESGTGKELVARAIHKLSPRLRNPFVALNCSAIPPTLLESEIFGHERGAFTGAIYRKKGCFEMADGGSIFLDEITEMPYELQSKLLRVLEERSFRRVGGNEEIRVDVHILAASNRDLKRAVEEARFRQDLYYRLNVFSIWTPPLRVRPEDIPVIVRRFIQDFNRKNKRNIKNIAANAMDILQKYHWPGNVRELKNTIERASIVCDTDCIQMEHLPPHLIEPRSLDKTSPPEKNNGESVISWPIPTPLSLIEQTLITKTLEFHSGNRTKAAKDLGISLKTIHNKIKKYHL